MDINTWFKEFYESIYMSTDIVSKVRLRYKSITKRINEEYWNSSSETNHSLYVGSYGRGTAIYASDIDIVVELPWTVKTRFDGRHGNIQSQLLSEVKDKLKKTYSTSKISSDGQVIVIDFSDGIKFEIVPAFKFDDNSYYYPNTNNGGSWKTMNPRLELEYFNARNKTHNLTMKKLCRMLRCWKETHNMDIPGELLDSIVYNFYLDANYIDKNPFLYFDFITRDLFEYLYKNAHGIWLTPGTYRMLNLKYPYLTQNKALEMYNKSIKAIQLCNDEYKYSAKDKWKEIYGEKF